MPLGHDRSQAPSPGPSYVEHRLAWDAPETVAASTMRVTELAHSYVHLLQNPAGSLLHF